MADIHGIGVLIVDDNRALAGLYTAWLAETYALTTAHAGDTLTALGDHIDIVRLDRRTPGVSGEEILAKIRNCDLDCRGALVASLAPDFDSLDRGFDT